MPRKASVKKPKTNEANPMEENIKIQTRKITNLKAACFDVIYSRMELMNEKAKIEAQIAEKGKEVERMQKQIEGEKKILAEMENG